MKIQDVMTRDPRCVTPQTSVQEAACVMKDEDVGVIPVVATDGERQLVGIVTDRDIALRIVAEGRDATTPVSDVMSHDRLSTCSPDEDIDSVMDAMSREQVRRIPIVDERGSLVGIVSQADIVRKANDRKAEQTVERISEPGGQHSR